MIQAELLYYSSPCPLDSSSFLVLFFKTVEVSTATASAQATNKPGLSWHRLVTFVLYNECVLHGNVNNLLLDENYSPESEVSDDSDCSIFFLKMPVISLLSIT